MSKQLWNQVGTGVVALTLLASCKGAPEAENIPPGEFTTKGVIFSAETVERFGTRYFPFSGPFWTPTAIQIAQMEDKLPGYLRDPGYLPNSGAWMAGTVLASLDTTKRQYIGYSDAGRKMIWLNGLCAQATEHVPDWKDRPLRIADGGPCFFQVHYDTAAGTFEKLYINGPI